VIQNKAEARWQALPPHFRLEGSLKQCTRDPFERDFVASVRLNHLHVLFLLRLLLLNTPAEPDMSMIEVAQQMLSLVVETILLRDQLVNSGTGLIWRVCVWYILLYHYTKHKVGCVLRPPSGGDHSPRNASTARRPSHNPNIMDQNPTGSQCVRGRNRGRNDHPTRGSQLRITLQSNTDYPAISRLCSF
jgi:hypothetical protein